MKTLLILFLALCGQASARPTLPVEKPALADWDCGGCLGAVSVELSGWPEALGDRGYNVYVSDVSGAEYRKVNAEPVRTRKLRLKGVAPGRRYYVVITTVVPEDGKPVESRPSAEFAVVAPGQPLPDNQIVGQCRGCKGSAQMTVRGWQVSPLRWYNLYLSKSEKKGFLRINDKPFNQPVAVIRNVDPGTRYYFKAVPVQKMHGRKDEEGEPLPTFKFTSPSH